MAKIIALDIDNELIREKGERCAANFGKAVNIRRIAEILLRYTNEFFVEALLKVLIEKSKPKDERLNIVNESGLYF